MQRNILQYLEETQKRLPDKIAYGDENNTITFSKVYEEARAVGSFLANKGYYKEPIVIFMKKQPRTLAAFFAAIYGGCFYVPLDEEMPAFRIELIFEKLKPRAVICDESTRVLLNDFTFSGEAYLYDELINTEINHKALATIRDKAIDTDPIYIVFTSGSTGIPKGVVACHRSVIDYIDNLMEVLKVDETTIFGNQTPFYFDACLKEVLGTIKCGATTYIIPKSHFMFPLKLVEFLNEYKINTVCWVVSALTMISSFRVLEKLIPEHLHTIAFGSEVFPIKQFNLWKEYLPSARFINLYGPTEATGMSCYYEVERAFNLEEVIPIGRPFKNTEVILLNDDNKVAVPGEIGEICIRGTSVTLGYYKDQERTAEVFVQNPLNDSYPELIYRTGDLGRYNQWGELIFVSRKDYQIKHMGHRIELGEIEANVNRLEGIKSSCCIYHKERDKIVLYYTGDIEVRALVERLKKKLPRYMIPNHTEALEVMPLTPNGKIDRVYLQNKFLNKKEK
ncbi:amino acid adenylation domain-containing protein [Alloiococcus sp. CFN-8]|uniref:amino acid adenylation domain-containing protein n=1 Tax=Alloiococcus sp. CFN-8 TaxID=3416081 RepID=UPI003CE908E7